MVRIQNIKELKLFCQVIIVLSYNFERSYSSWFLNSNKSFMNRVKEKDLLWSRKITKS